MSKSSLEAAAEAAARVNAMLIAKGKLKLPPNQIKPKIGHLLGERITDDLITAEVEINDAPLGARNLLTRGHTQDEICKYSGAAISTRGRYMTFDEKLMHSTGDRPLYLHVQAPKRESVDLAVSRILEMIAQYDKSAAIKIPVTNISPVNKPVTETLTPIIPTGMHFVQEKVFIGLEAPASFPVRDKILGPGGSYLQHIKMETGANVILRGRGSGYIEPTSGREAFEPLYIHLTHPKPEGLHAAKVLAMNLVDTVHVEYAQWQQQQQQSVMTVPIGPAQIAYQSLIGSTQVSVPQGLPLPAVSMALPEMSYPVVVSSAPLMTPVLNATVENIFTSSASSLALPAFQPEYVNTLSLNQVSSIREMTPILSNPILSSSPFTTPIEVLTNHLPVMLAPEAHTPLNVSLSTSVVPQPSVISMQPDLSVFPTAQHQILESRHPGLDFHQAAPIQMSPFNPQLRLTCASPNSITFPPPASPMLTHPQIMPTNYLTRDMKFENELLNNKRKFMEDPDSMHPNIGLQERDAPFKRVLSLRPRMMMPPPPSPFRPMRPQHFRTSRFPVPQRKRDYISSTNSPKTDIVVEKFNKKLTAKASELAETDNAKERRGALSGLATVYGSDDSDDEITNNPVPTRKRKI